MNASTRPSAPAAPAAHLRRSFTVARRWHFRSGLDAGTFPFMQGRTLVSLSVLLAGLGALSAQAHDFKADALRIDHPYATPTRPGLTMGAVYFRGIRNTGASADKLVSASTPVAERVEIHRMQMRDEVMQMRAVPALEMPAGATVTMKQGAIDGHHLMLLHLRAPLKDGDRFPVTLTFEKAGAVEVTVWVQTPRRPAPGSNRQHH